MPFSAKSGQELVGKSRPAGENAGNPAPAALCCFGAGRMDITARRERTSANHESRNTGASVQTESNVVKLRRPGLARDAVDRCQHGMKNTCVADHGDLLEAFFSATGTLTDFEVETFRESLRPG
jgi:hypothetical protein